jgi:tRNA A37 methylthiotransferase MiaB
MLKAGEDAAHRFREEFVGKTVKVLTESYHRNRGFYVGLSSNYIRIKVLDVSSACQNKIVSVKLIEPGTGSGTATGRLTNGEQGGSFNV